MRTVTICAIATLFSTYSPMVQGTESRTTFAMWIDKAMQDAEGSAFLKASTLKIDRYRHEYSATDIYDPFSLSTSAQRVDARPLPGTSESQRQFSYVAIQRSKYSSPNSLEASVDLEGRYGEKENFPVDFLGNTGRVVEKDVLIRPTLSYDLTRGGTKSRQNIQRQAENLSSQINYLGALEEKLSAISGAYNMIAPLFFLTCKQSFIAEYRKAVGETLKEAEVKLKANLISQRDFLSVQNLELILARQELSEEQQRSQALLRLDAMADIKNEIIQSLQDIDCTSQNLPGPGELDGDLLKPQIGSHLALRTLNAQLKIIDLTHSSKRLERTASVKPFVTGEYHLKNSADKTDTGNAALGIAVDWVIPSDKVRFEDSASFSARNSLVHSLDTRRNEIQSYFASIKGETTRRLKAHSVLVQGDKNAEEYLKATRVALKFGLADMLSFSSALQASSDQKKSIIDSWAEIERSRFEFSIAKKRLSADALTGAKH